MLGVIFTIYSYIYIISITHGPPEDPPSISEIRKILSEIVKKSGYVFAVNNFNLYTKNFN